MAGTRKLEIGLDTPPAYVEAMAWSPGWPDSATVLEFLGAPTSIGPLRTATIERLEKETGEDFGGDYWTAVEWLKQDIERSK